jgi:hypothetical protein
MWLKIGTVKEVSDRISAGRAGPNEVGLVGLGKKYGLYSMHLVEGEFKIRVSVREVIYMI